MLTEKHLPVAASALALWPMTASASDMTGMVTVLALMWIVAPATLVHLVVMAVLAATGLYRKRAVALWHARIASVAPLLGIAAAMLELGGRQLPSLLIVLLILLAVLALSWLPMVIHAHQQPVYVRKHQFPGEGWH